MKKYVSIIAMLLFAFTLNVKAVNSNNGSSSRKMDCECCKDCKDDKCKDLCKQWSELSDEAKKGPEGKKIKDECKTICKDKKKCSSSGKSSCEGMNEGKSCCKKK